MADIVKGNIDIIRFIRSDIPAKNISTEKNPFGSFYVKLNFRKKKAIQLVLQSK